VSCLKKCGASSKLWAFYDDYPDIMEYERGDIIEKMKPPTLANSRNQMICAEMDKYWGDM